MPSIYFFGPVHSAAILDTLGAAREIRYAPPLYPCSMRAACDGSQTQRVRAWVCVVVLERD